MAKFKVGDRVRVIRDGSSHKGSGHGANIGHTFTVRIDEDGDITDGERFFYPDELSLCEELTPLTIETGKFYRTRDGRKVGPMADQGDTAYDTNERLLVGDVDRQCRLFRAAGGRHLFGDADLDLIAKWIDEPVSNDSAPIAEQKAGAADITITISSDTTALEASLDGIIGKLERIRELKAELAV